jgi:hypothetical protein
MNKFLKFFSKFFLTFSFILFIFILYKHKIYDYNKLDKNSLKYIYFFGIIFLFFIIFYFLNNKIKEKIFLVSISTLFSIYLFEGYLVFNQYQSSVEYHAKKNNEYYDNRSRYEYFLEKKNKNPNIAVSLPPFIIHREYFRNPKYYNLLPLGGLSKKQTIFCNESGYFVEYLSDRYGFNNPDKEWDKNKQILFLGDSYLHGVCVFEKDTITGNLRSKISNKNYGVINLGQRGNGPLSEYAGLVEYSKNINPEIILWVYYEGNDLKNLKYEKKIDILNNYLILDDFSQDLSNKQLYLDKLLEKVLINRLEFEKRTFYYIKNNKFLTILKLHNLRKFISKINFKNKAEINYKKEIEDFKVLLERASSFAKKKDAKFLFVYIPSYKRINKKNSLDEKLFNYKEIIEIIEDLNISYIDLNMELLQKTKDPLVYYPYGLPKHFNEEGYKSISNIIFKKINNYIN